MLIQLTTTHTWQSVFGTVAVGCRVACCPHLGWSGSGQDCPVGAGSKERGSQSREHAEQSLINKAVCSAASCYLQRPQTLVARTWHHHAKSGFLRPPKQHQTQVQMKAPAPGARTPSPNFPGCLEQYKYKQFLLLSVSEGSRVFIVRRQ